MISRSEALSVRSSRAGLAMFSRNLSAECRMPRRKEARAVLAFFIFLEPMTISLVAMRQLGVTS
jgi:hypothetical protein